MGIIREKEQREVKKVKDVICDVCEESTYNGANFSYAKLSANWLYGSPKDTQVHEACICESCYDKIVEAFSIKVHKGEHLICDPDIVCWHDN